MKQVDLDGLINAPKKISKFETSRNVRIQKGSEHYDCFAISVEDETLQFKIFVRQNQKFIDKFSVGLVYLPKTGDDICLVRCNGFHEHTNHVKDYACFSGFHIHRATEEAIMQGHSSEQYAIMTEDYRTLPQALSFFWNYVNIQEKPHQYFPQLLNGKQLPLPLFE